MARSIRYPRLRLTLAAALACGTLTAHAQTTAPAVKQPKPLIPSQVKANPTLYINREIRVAGQPNLTQDPATGKWTGTSDGAKVELTPGAKQYLDRTKPLGVRPVFRAELVRRNGELIILYKEGVNFSR